MSPGEGLEVVLTMGVHAPWTTLMISADITETVIIPLGKAEEGELNIKSLIANLNEYNHTFVGFVIIIMMMMMYRCFDLPAVLMMNGAEVVVDMTVSQMTDIVTILLLIASVMILGELASRAAAVVAVMT